MQPQVTPLDGSKAIGITCTDKPVTAFGGLALFVAFAQRIGLAAKLAEALPFVLTSPNATPPHHIVLAFLAGVLAGARRFAQRAVLQADVPVRPLFGLRRFPSTATVTRFFRRFTPKAITATVVREELAVRPTARGRELFQVPGYRFHAIVTTPATPPEEVWRTATGRADSENRVKELQHAFGADGCCSRRFSGTEAALRSIGLLSNLVGEFQRSLGHVTLRTLATLRTTLFACGAILGADGRQPMLRLSRAKPWQATLLAYLQRLFPTPATCNAVPATEANV
jgi:hypothetical protein